MNLKPDVKLKKFPTAGQSFVTDFYFTVSSTMESFFSFNGKDVPDFSDLFNLLHAKFQLSFQIFKKNNGKYYLYCSEIQKRQDISLFEHKENYYAIEKFIADCCFEIISTNFYSKNFYMVDSFFEPLFLVEQENIDSLYFIDMSSKDVLMDSNEVFIEKCYRHKDDGFFMTKDGKNICVHNDYKPISLPSYDWMV